MRGTVFSRTIKNVDDHQGEAYVSSCDDNPYHPVCISFTLIGIGVYHHISRDTAVSMAEALKDAIAAYDAAVPEVH
jgi:hypothetical protein